MQTFAPVQASEREIFMDILRGFAIPGRFIMRIIISILWQKNFNYDSVEWVWRSATYKKWQPMIKNKTVEE